VVALLWKKFFEFTYCFGGLLAIASCNGCLSTHSCHGPFVVGIDGGFCLLLATSLETIPWGKTRSHLLYQVPFLGITDLIMSSCSALTLFQHGRRQSGLL
jgi:hypothetical protein